ncbi:hypothetical protein Hdeb2414_s0010g00347341 [Helianthus debilis subsp. tardiflorus]
MAMITYARLPLVTYIQGGLTRRSVIDRREHNLYFTRELTSDWNIHQDSSIPNFTDFICTSFFCDTIHEKWAPNAT